MTFVHHTSKSLSNKIKVIVSHAYSLFVYGMLSLHLQYVHILFLYVDKEEIWRRRRRRRKKSLCRHSFDLPCRDVQMEHYCDWQNQKSRWEFSNKRNRNELLKKTLIIIERLCEKKRMKSSGLIPNSTTFFFCLFTLLNWIHRSTCPVIFTSLLLVFAYSHRTRVQIYWQSLKVLIFFKCVYVCFPRFLHKINGK